MLFKPPQDLQIKVFAHYPDELRTAGPDNEWVRGQPAGAPPGSLLEGPPFDRESNLWCVDSPNGRIFKVDPSGTFHVMAQYNGWPNGLRSHKDGRIFIADYQHGIMEVNPVSGVVKRYLLRFGIERFKAVNDLFFAANGDLYFTDQALTGLHDPTRRVFRLTPDARVDCLLDNVPIPNGLVMNLDESTLYVAVTRGNCIWRVPLMPHGRVAKVGPFVQLSGGLGGPDGIALDAEGRLVIDHVGMGSVWLVDRLGEPIIRIRIRICTDTHTTNVAYGGPDNKTLYITESGSGTIPTAELDVPGKTMFSHQA